MTYLILGATSELGKTLSHRYAQQGVSLWLVGRKKHHLKSLAEDVKKGSQRDITITVCDMSIRTEVETLCEQIAKTEVDAALNLVAEHGEIGPFELSSTQDWERTFNINFFAAVEITKALVRSMKKFGKPGNVVHFSGGGVTAPRAFFTQYSTSKSALVSFCASAAQETSPFGISLNCVAPGMMPSKMLKQVVDAGSNLVSEQELENARRILSDNEHSYSNVCELCAFLMEQVGAEISGRLISAAWDKWYEFDANLNLIKNSDLFTLRRITPDDHTALAWETRETS